MKILILTDEMMCGGVSRHVIDLSNELYTSGMEVGVAATDGAFRKRLKKEISFIALPLLKNNSYKKQLLGSWYAYRILRKHLSHNRYDIIHTHKRYSDLIGRLLARQYGIVHISTCHNTFSSLRWLSCFGDYTIAVSESIHSILIHEFKKPEDRVFMIRVGVPPLPRYSAEAQEQFKSVLGLTPTTRVIVSVGHLIPSKDRTTLLKAMSMLHISIKNDNITLLIVGDGPEKKNLQRLASSYGIKRSVLFLDGQIDIALIMNVAEFCVISSIQEGLPYVLLEAASLEKPHVATNVGGVSEFVTNEQTGLLVPSRSPEMLAQAIEKLIENPDLSCRLGKEACNRWREEYSFDTFINKTIDVYTLAVREKVASKSKT